MEWGRWKIIHNVIVDGVLLGILILAAFFIDSRDGRGSDTDVSGVVSRSVREYDETYEKCIAITFDDGPHGKTTERLLDELKRLDVKATFFLIGENVAESDENAALVKRMHDEGHLIGNHSYSHINIKETGRDNALLEIEKTNQIISGITGESVRYIRPPYGLYDESFLDCVDMVPVLWNIDPVDWDTTDVSKIVDNVTKNAADRGIILMHDCYESSVTAAVEIIERLRDRGYIFVTVEEILVE